MSSGAEGNPLILSPYFQSIDYYREWEGTDGKYETVGAFTRPKWNYYFLKQRTTRKRMTNSINYVYGAYEGAPPQNATAYILCGISDVDCGVSQPANFQLEVISKLFDQIKGHDFNLAVNLAELTKTSSMVVSNLGKLGRSISALKRGDFGHAARQLGMINSGTSLLKSKDVSGRWLELQYGWRPLLAETYNAAKAYEALTKGPRVLRFHAHKSLPWKEYEMSQVPSLYQQKCLHKFSKYISCELQEDISLARQLGLIDPASVAWELMPYSFVVDWFIPIGTYIDLLMNIPFLKGRFMTSDYRETKCSTRATGIPERGWWAGNWIYSRDPLPVDTLRFKRTYRYPSSVLKVPSPQFNFSGIFQGKRIWNAISLAHQRFAN